MLNTLVIDKIRLEANMNPGIFYLYEYNNTQKLRNTGFLKITRNYRSCTLQLNARGIPVSFADTVTLSVFYMKNNLAEAVPLAEITCANRALSARLTSVEAHFPDGMPLERMDGFFLSLPNGHILAAAAPGITIDAQKLLSPSGGSLSMESTPDSTQATPEAPASDLRIPPETVNEASDEPVPAHEIPNEFDRTNEARNEAAQTDDTQNETTPETESSSDSEMKPQPHNRPAAPVTQEFVTEQECSAQQEDAVRQDCPDKQEHAAGQDCPEEQEHAAGQDCPKEQEHTAGQDCPEEQQHTARQDCPEEQKHTAGQDCPEEQEHTAGQDCPEEQEHTAGQDCPDEQEHAAGQDCSEEQEHTAGQERPEEQDSVAEQDSTAESDSSCQDSHQQNIKKIQRSEMSALPRRYWHLANNSFLLHGYHNYNHLLLIEKDGHYWLGVPGIYDPHEARAARLFGFPQFTDSYNHVLMLSDDECAPNEKFGYWCCYLK